jgi:GNAT superfamily N-acetyltransferase
MNTSLVAYSALTEQQAAALRLLQVEPEQRKACGDIDAALYILGNGRPDAVTGWALLVDQQPRAFLLLMRAPCLPAWAAPSAALLLSLQVDHRYQKQGLGTACLQALPGVVRSLWPDINQLTLSVDPANSAALMLYRAQGWTDRGSAHRSATGYERKLVLAL